MSAERALEILGVGPLATVQDAGRAPRASLGIPAGGAWDQPLFARTIAALASAAAPARNALELPLLGARVRASGGPLLCSVDGVLVPLSDGEALTVDRATHAIRYLAVAGGFDVETVLGGEGTTLVALSPLAGFGGFQGRPLRVGDRVPVRASRHDHRLTAPAPLDVGVDATLDGLETIAVHLAAPCDPATREWLERAEFVLDSRTNRLGATLRSTVAAPVSSPLLASRPLVRGAMQLPPSGAVIVMGPDGPTTGGYRVIAVLGSHAQARLARLRPASAVRWRIVHEREFFPR